MGFIVSINTIGQQLSYKGGQVDTVKINSNSSYYHFDSLGTTSGTYDEYLINYNVEKNSYYLEFFRRTEYRITYKPDTLIEKSKILNSKKSIDNILISNLLSQFDTSYVEPTINQLGLTSKEFQKLTKKKQILKVAKFHDEKWQFKRTYSTKEKNQKIFDGCQQTDTFDLYLKTVFDTTGYVVITDVDSRFEVEISTNKKDFLFEGKYPNPFRQPWYYFSEDGDVFTTTVLNLSINNALVEILPKEFTNFSTLKIEALIDDYIEWYLKRREIIY